MAGLSAIEREALAARFWKSVNKTADQHGCWLWTGCCDKNGYGQITVSFGIRLPFKTHRLAWFLTFGTLPHDCLCHRCDRPGCVNPAHLFEGSQADNLDDARRKGRLIDGLGARKLTDAEYRAILTAPRVRGMGRQLAKRYGISTVSVSRIWNGHQGSTFHGLSLRRTQASRLGDDVSHTANMKGVRISGSRPPSARRVASR